MEEKGRERKRKGMAEGKKEGGVKSGRGRGGEEGGGGEGRGKGEIMEAERKEEKE